ncbi:MAG: hypothetical protein JSV88_03585 [Candidatus Aminicenantes bacterium]|nr:MAG: hypothetical protein JSV88_03585 [Candidatus Aminicenantes bacterium]
MVFKVFVDTNVILDIFLKREPFFDNSQKFENEWIEVQTPEEYLTSISHGV